MGFDVQPPRHIPKMNKPMFKPTAQHPEKMYGEAPTESPREETKKDDVGTVGFGFDPSCGSIEPTINLGGGMGLGLDGHITFKLF